MTVSRIADPSLFPDGLKKISWARQRMPVIAALEARYFPDQPLAGISVGTCLHLEAKTASLLLTLKNLGAKVSAAGSNPLSTQDDVCAALVHEGVEVYSRRGMSSIEYHDNLRSVLDADPTIIIDDGADLVVLLHEERPAMIRKVLGGSEETTTGVKRLKAMEREGILGFPMISVNDAHSKYLFDNRYGTGQSVIDGLMRATNIILAGKVCVVVGYGWCGRGFAMRAKAMGARVAVVEVDPHRAYEALMDGCAVLDMKHAASEGDIFVTFTGNLKVIRGEHLSMMKDGAILANAGHFDVEIDKKALESLSAEIEEVRDNVRTYVMKDGRKLNLLADGRLVNLAAADGHPIEIMDLSFALQLQSAIFIRNNRLKPGVYNVPEDIDAGVIREGLSAQGVRIEKLTSEQERYLLEWRE